jgi:hypothetical protein
LPGAPSASWTEGLVALESVEQGALQLIAFGDELSVLEPEPLRREMHRLAQAVLTLHQPQSSTAAS